MAKQLKEDPKIDALVDEVLDKSDETGADLNVEGLFDTLLNSSQDNHLDYLRAGFGLAQQKEDVYLVDAENYTGFFVGKKSDIVKKLKSLLAGLHKEES